MVVISVVLSIALCVLMFVAMWKIYSKAGQPGWAILVPIYNIIVFLRIVNKPWWWLLLFLIPIVNFVLMIIVIHRLSKSFGNGVGFTLGLIFLSFIFMLILGFGNYTYQKLD